MSGQLSAFFVLGCRIHQVRQPFVSGVVNKLMPIVPLSTPAVCMVRSDHARNQQKTLWFQLFFKEHVCVLRDCGRVIGPLISNSIL